MRAGVARPSIRLGQHRKAMRRGARGAAAGGASGCGGWRHAGERADGREEGLSVAQPPDVGDDLVGGGALVVSCDLEVRALFELRQEVVDVVDGERAWTVRLHEPATDGGWQLGDEPLRVLAG
jgi:hypothetical protein